ncbi:MAG: 4-alpha-glucanotransferase [Actinomycetales bacterium]|nr:4-alpha-glucanotransferase [Actinomycetales bacterium]
MSVPSAPEWRPVPEDLSQLAEAYGVATEYWDQAGQLVKVGEATVGAVLAALGLDVSSPEAIARAREEKRLRDWRRTLPPVFVMRQGADQRLWVHVPDGRPAAAWVELEDGDRRDLEQMDYWVDPVDVDGVLVGEASFRIPGDLPLGWHTIHATSDDIPAHAPLVIAPTRLDPEAIAGNRQWGFMTQVYAMRSRASWGMGDLHDLADLATWSGGDLGAGFVLINPLHAASPVPPMAPSPYLPVTRRFANPLYLRIEDIPEFEGLAAPVRARIEELAAQLRRLDLTADLLDRDAVWGAKRTALEAIRRVPLSAERQALFDAYVVAQGSGLEDFATWCAIGDEHGAPEDWPAELAHPRAPEVTQFRADHREVVDFHMWLQWLIDEQLTRTQAQATAAGMAIGVMHDLAVGVHPEGADAWALQDVLARGVSVGAPPDMYNQMGQDWSQPPWRPDALAEAAFVPYRDMLRTVLAHAGGLRIDHVLGLFRLWWVPQGFPAYAGTFVRFDFDAMLSVLMLEAHRAGAIIVGEDLGTVEPWVQEALVDRGILGTSILWFETESGVIRDPYTWRRDVLASVTVHDLPPTAGYLRDEHVRIRAELDLLTTPEAEERENAARERAAWAAVLTAHGWLAEDVDLSTDEGLEALTVALHRAVAASPARLVGIALPDVVGDRRAQNQPGTDQEYPNWRVPMTDGHGNAVTLEQLRSGSDLLERLVATVR